MLIVALTLRADSVQRCVLIAYDRGTCKTAAVCERASLGLQKCLARALDILEAMRNRLSRVKGCPRAEQWLKEGNLRYSGPTMEDEG